jgi:hypothetical protein
MEREQQRFRLPDDSRAWRERSQEQQNLVETDQGLRVAKSLPFGSREESFRLRRVRRAKLPLDLFKPFQ